MTEATPSPVSAADAWFLGTYRRHDLLDVPAFRDSVAAAQLHPQRASRTAVLHSLPTDLPREVQGWDEWLSGARSEAVDGLSPVRKLSLLFRYFASPLRYEGRNSYAVHRAVPSARCLYPLDYLLIRRSGTELFAYRYVPDFHALEPLGTCPGGEVEGDWTFAVLVVARIWSIADKYGDFAPFPCVLEGGMVAAQLRHLKGLAGWDSSARVAREVGEAFCTGGHEVPLLGEALGAPDIDIAGLPRRTVRLGEWNETAGLDSRFPKLGPLCDAFAAGEAPAPPPRASRAGPSADPSARRGPLGLLAVLRGRNSGNDLAGMSPRIPLAPGGLLDELLAAWRSVSARRNTLPAENLLSPRVVWLAATGGRSGVYDSDGTLLTPGAGRAALTAAVRRSLPSPDFRYNLSAHSVMLTVACDPHAARERLGEAALRETHLAVGAVAQDFSLAAAALGMFARPVRMLRETVLEAELPLGGQLLYVVLGGFNRSANPFSELL